MQGYSLTIDCREDGKWHVAPGPGKLSVYWDTWEEAAEYAKARIASDLDLMRRGIAAEPAFTAAEPRCIATEEDSQKVYANIRDLLGYLIGRQILDITQHDLEEFKKDGQCYVQLMLERGEWVKFFVGEEGFEFSKYEEDEDGLSEAK